MGRTSPICCSRGSPDVGSNFVDIYLVGGDDLSTMETNLALFKEIGGTGTSSTCAFCKGCDTICPEVSRGTNNITYPTV